MRMNWHKRYGKQRRIICDNSDSVLAAVPGHIWLWVLLSGSLFASVGALLRDDLQTPAHSACTRRVKNS